MKSVNIHTIQTYLTKDILMGAKATILGYNATWE